MVAEDHDLTYASSKLRAVGAEGPGGHAPPLQILADYS